MGACKFVIKMRALCESHALQDVGISEFKVL